MNKWQAWWDKANEVIDAAPNGVDYYWLAARPTDAVPEVKLFRFEQIVPGQVEIVRHRIYFEKDAYQPAARQEGRQTMGAGEARCFWENHVEYGWFRLRSLKGETV